jgi:hypothetical protein
MKEARQESWTSFVPLAMSGESGRMNPPGRLDVTQAGRGGFQLLPIKIREGEGIFNLPKKKAGEGRNHTRQICYQPAED